MATYKQDLVALTTDIATKVDITAEFDSGQLLKDESQSEAGVVVIGSGINTAIPKVVFEGLKGMETRHDD